jgi:CelD/BcsL family acetyltransferase involved in cellulose biosynthesis
MDVREFNDPARLQELRPAWSTLLEQTAGASFFQTLDWLEAYWRHYGQSQRLRVIVTFDQGEPSGILPLVVRREPTKLGHVKFLTYPLDYWGSYYGPIGPRPQETLERGLAYLHSSAVRRDWDVLELRWVGGTNEALAQTEAALHMLQLPVEQCEFDSSGIVTLEGTWEDYLARRTSKWRNNLRRSQRRLAERGARYVRYRTDGQNVVDPRWEFFDACLRIAHASWQSDSTDGTTLSHASIQPFLRDLHAAAAKCGGIDLNLLFLEDEPIAFAYNYHYHGNVFGLRAGYDATACRDGVGNVLYAHIIEDAYQRGDWRYDMGPGSLALKRYFIDETLPLYRLSCFQPLSLRQQLLRWKRRRDARRQPERPAK